MTKTILRVLMNAFLIIIPFFPVLENFYLPVNGGNFSGYLIACTALSVLILGIGLLVSRDNDSCKINDPKLAWAAYSFFFLGIIVIVPLHMGPPRQGEELLGLAGMERLRYIMLLVAALFFGAGCTFGVKPLWAKLTVPERAVVIPVMAAVFISLWDYYDSFMLGSYLKEWRAVGKSVEHFAPNYHYHETSRAIGRILLYVTPAWLSIILYRQHVLKKWVAISLNIFCLTGSGFCVLFLLKGFTYYFPFMVPAIALAPAYWIGISLLNSLPSKLAK